MNIFHALQALRPYIKSYVSSWSSEVLILFNELKIASTQTGMAPSFFTKKKQIYPFLWVWKNKKIVYGLIAFPKFARQR